MYFFVFRIRSPLLSENSINFSRGAPLSGSSEVLTPKTYLHVSNYRTVSVAWLYVGLTVGKC